MRINPTDNSHTRYAIASHDTESLFFFNVDLDDLMGLACSEVKIGSEHLPSPSTASASSAAFCICFRAFIPVFRAGVL